MVPSPRKRAPPTTIPAFNQTWDDNDAAFLDPNSLPLPKIPRGWERKQEIKKLGEGKEKKIWRRFNLRSRAANTNEEDEEDQHDSQSRAVKKLQRMSPKAMEKSTAGVNGKKRAFKATRWDRRKSVLPRKKNACIEDSLADKEDTDEIDNDVQEGDNDSLSEMEAVGDQLVEAVPSSLPEVHDRRSTFTFTMDAPTVDDLPDYESLDGLEETDRTLDPASADDATLTNLFRSPTKAASRRYSGSPGKIVYPELPHSDYEDTEIEIHTETMKATEMIVESDNIEEASFEVESHENHITERVEMIEAAEINKADHDIAQTSLEARAVPLEITYPTLPMETQEISMPLPFDENHDEGEDDQLSGMTQDPCLVDEFQDNDTVEEGAMGSLEGGASDEEFTEASLQLNIQREYEEANRAEAIVPMEVKGQHVEVNTDSEMEQTSTEIDITMYPERGSAEKVDEKSEDCEASQSTTLATLANGVVQPELALSPRQQGSVETPIDDITDGLTLSFTPIKPRSADPTPRKLHSPPPPPRVESGPEDVTMTIAIDDDTAILKDFLNRAAASKAEKAATITHRRESLQNRRDSDVVRHALASPRKILEDKDPNSPSKYDNDATLDLSQTLTLSMPNDDLLSPTPDQADVDDTADEKSLRGSRRSSRAKKSRLPAPASAAQAQASKIAIRRADGNEVVVLKKSDAQELATVTRANTRKNKQGAFGVTVRLLKLAADAASLPPVDDSTKELIVGKNVRWDEQLAYYQENPETMANLLAEAESLATPDELSMSDPSSTPAAKSKTSKNSTPKIRRVRGLGTANGTPGKGLLAPASLLPEAVQEEKEVKQAPAQQLPRPKASKIKKMPVASTSIDSGLSSNSAVTKLPTLDVAPVGVASTTQRKSRLTAPKKVLLPQPVSSIASEGKENAQRPGISDATPRKGIPAPKVVVPPTAGMESGLPRRRGRKY